MITCLTLFVPGIAIISILESSIYPQPTFFMLL